MTFTYYLVMVDVCSQSTRCLEMLSKIILSYFKRVYTSFPSKSFINHVKLFNLQTAYEISTLLNN